MGDWIKVREELKSHPRFLAMCSILIFDEQKNEGLLHFVCGDALGIGAVPPDQKPLYERALQCVTERALRDVALCALQRVWSAVNSHCKVEESDAVMSQ